MVELVRETTDGFTVVYDGEQVTEITTTNIKDSYIIREQNETIGYIQVTGNTLVQIEVFTEHQGEGYGTEALEQVMEIFQHSDYSTVTTTTVISPVFESILLDYGFTSTDTPNENTYQYSF